MSSDQGPVPPSIWTCTTSAPAPGPVCGSWRPSNTMCRAPKSCITGPGRCNTARYRLMALNQVGDAKRS